MSSQNGSNPSEMTTNNNNENKPNASREVDASTKLPVKKKATEKKKKAPASANASSSQSQQQAPTPQFSYYPHPSHAYMNPYGPAGMSIPPPHTHVKGGPTPVAQAAAATAAAMAAHYPHGPHPHAYGYPHPYAMAPHPYYSQYAHPAHNPYAVMAQTQAPQGSSQNQQLDSTGSGKPSAKGVGGEGTNNQNKAKRNSIGGQTSSSTSTVANATGPSSSNKTNMNVHPPSNMALLHHPMPPQAHQYFMAHPAMAMQNAHPGIQMPPPSSSMGQSKGQHHSQTHGQVPSNPVPIQAKRNSDEAASSSNAKGTAQDKNSTSTNMKLPARNFQPPPTRRMPLVTSTPKHHAPACAPSASPGHWTPQEDDMLRSLIEDHGNTDWKVVAKMLPGRTETACQTRWQKVLKRGLVRGPWTEQEDQKLAILVEKYGPRKWTAISEELTGRSGKQCRERWHNHLNPNVNRQAWSEEEDRLILLHHKKIGNRWAEMSKFLPGR
jgi:hypothetical protein